MNVFTAACLSFFSKAATWSGGVCAGGSVDVFGRATAQDRGPNKETWSVLTLSACLAF